MNGAISNERGREKRNILRYAKKQQLREIEEKRSRREKSFNEIVH
jgi:hypothetical protein